MLNITTCCNGVPPYLNPCTTTLRSGGISRIVFADCSVKFNDITDPAEWCYLVKKGKIIVTGELVAQKPKGTFNSKNVSSCHPQVNVGKTNTITFTDYYLDTVNFKDYLFYNKIRKGHHNMMFGYITCDGSFSGFVDKFSIELDDVIEESNTACTYWDGTITWNGMDSIKPIFIDGLLNLLHNKCEGVVNFQICNIYEELDAESFSTPGLLRASVRTTLNPCGGFIQVVTPFVLNATYIYGYYRTVSTIIGDTTSPIDGLLFAPDPVLNATSDGNSLITDLIPNNQNGIWVAVYDPDCTNPSNTNLDIFYSAGDAGVPHINYLYLYDFLGDSRPFFAQSPNPPFGIYTVLGNGCYTNGYGDPAIDISINENFNDPIDTLEYQLQINGVPANWQDSNNIFTNVPNGIHNVLIRSKLTGCVRMSGFSTNITININCP